MARAEAIPARIRWAVDVLDPSPTDRVLEIGCGPGVAAVLVADRLTTGHVTAIDRSATAVERTAARGRAHVEAGRLTVQRSTLADLADLAVLAVDVDLGPPNDALRFDKVFAVNVNLFWTSTAEAELAVLRAALAPAGVLLLVYEAPGDRAREIAGRVTEALEAQRFSATVRTGPDPSLVAIVATPG